MVKFIAVVSTLFLVGCASTIDSVKEVNVVIPVKVKLDKPNRPSLAIHSLTETSEPDVVLKSYAATIKQLIGYSKELENVIDSYNKE